MPGAMITAAGSALIVRSATRFRPAYAARINTAESGYETRAALGGRRGVLVDEAVTINRPASELYSFWRRFSDLPRFMDHLVSVTCSRDLRFSHWVAKAPGGRTVEWDARVINDIPDELIAWRTIGKADVVSAGSVRFIGESEDAALKCGSVFSTSRRLAGSVRQWPGCSATNRRRRFARIFAASNS